MNYIFVPLQFAKFRQLLKEAIILNDRLRKHTESRTDNGDNSTSLDLAELRRSDDATTDGKSVSLVQNESSAQNSTDMSAEKRTVRIVPAHQNHLQHHSPSSAPKLQSDFSPVIDDQESAKIWV